jgi:hypothetical protein
LDAPIPETRFLTLKQSSNLQKTLEKIHRESMAGQQTFYYLLAILGLLVLTGTSGANYAAGGSACHTNDCHRPQVRHHKRILKHGSRGEDVKKLQKVLNALGLCPEPIVIDGVFGPTTLDAVKRFQRQANLHVDGVVGGKTWDRLFASS